MPFPKDQDLLPAFENFDLWSAGLPENRRALVENHFKFTAPEDLEEERKHFLSVALISQRTGRDAEEVSRNLETLYIPSFAKDVRGLNMAFPPKDAGEFYQQARIKLIDEKDERETFGEGSMAAFRGDDVIPALQAWQAKNGLERMAKSTAFTKGFLGAREWAGDQLEFASNLLGQIESNIGLTKNNGEKPDKPSLPEAYAQFEESLATLADMKPEDRKKVYAIMSAKAEASGYDPKGFWSQTLSYIGKGLDRATSTVTASSSDLLAGGSMVGGDAAGGFSPVPADAQERFQQGMEQRGKRSVVYAELANLVAGSVDPFRPTVSWMNDTFEEGLVKGPGAVLPFMAASVALGPYGAGVLFTADFAEQNRRDLVISGMDEGQARVIGMAAAPLQAVTESLSNALQLGRFPAVQKVLAGFTKPIGGGAGLITRYVQNSAISLGTEFTEEQLQDNFIVPATQELLGALQVDVPEVDWSMYRNRAIESTPELLSVLAPMALVFGGTMTAAQANLSAVAISSQDMLEAAGFSSAQANTIRSETAPEAQIAKARELWGQRAGTAKSIEDAAKSVGERMKQLQTDHMAAQLDMERRGILPRMLRSSEDNWRLTFSDGSTADFHTHQDADAARWQWATDQLGKVHLATREALAQMEKNAAVGREFAVEFKPDAMTAKQAVEEGRATPAQIDRRIAQGEASGEVSEEETFSNAASIDKATSDYLSSLQILGSSANEFKDGVLRTTIRLYEGAHVLTLVEEKLEGDAKQILASKPGSEWMLRSLRNYEQISGDSILRKVPDSELTQDDLIEAWSSLGQSYLVGKSKKGAAIGKGGARRIFADVLKAGMGGAMNSETQFLNAVWRRAAKLSKLKREGKLGEDLTAELERQLGIDSQAAHEAAVADGVAAAMSYSEENPGPNGETFSMTNEHSPGGLSEAEVNASIFRQLPSIPAGKFALVKVTKLSAKRGTDVVRHPDGGFVAIVPASSIKWGSWERTKFRAFQKAAWPFQNNVFVRVSNSADDLKHLKNGTHRGSINHATGEAENGLSVSHSPEIPAKYAYLVQGDVVGEGTDGEPLINPQTAKVIGSTKTYNATQAKIKAAQEAMGLDENTIYNIAYSRPIAEIEVESADFVNPESSRAAGGTFSLRKFPLPPGLAEAAQKARGESSLILAYQAAQRGSSSAMVPIRSVYEQAKKYQPALTPAQFMAEVNALNDSGKILVGLSETTQAVEAAGEFRVGGAGTEMAFAPQETFSLAEPSPGGLSEAESRKILSDARRKRTELESHYTSDAHDVWSESDARENLESELDREPSPEEVADYIAESQRRHDDEVKELLWEHGTTINHLVWQQIAEDALTSLGVKRDGYSKKSEASYWYLPGVTAQNGDALSDDYRIRVASHDPVYTQSDTLVQYDLREILDDNHALEAAIESVKDLKKEITKLNPSFESSRAAGGTSYSLRSGDFASRMAAAFSPFQRSPELRRLMGKLAHDRVMRLAADLIDKANVIRPAASVEKEQRFREADSYEKRITAYLDSLTPAARQTLEFEPAELESDPLIAAMLDHGKLMSFTTAKKQGKVEAKAGDYDGAPWLPPAWYSKGAGIMPDQMAQAMHDAGLLPDAYTDTLWAALANRIEQGRKDKAAHREAVQSYKDAASQARSEAKKEAQAWADKQRKDSGSAKAQRDRLKAWLRTLDAILSAAPPEVRAKVGGYIKLAGLATDEAMLKEIENRIAKLDVELSKWLKKEYTENIKKVLKKNRSTRGKGGQMEGRTVANVTEQIDYAANFSEISKVEQDKEIAHLESIIADDKSTADQIDAAVSRLGIAELFYDFENQDAGALGTISDWLDDLVSSGRDVKKALDEDRREYLTNLKTSGITSILGVPNASQTDAENVAEKIKGSILRQAIEKVKGSINSVLPTTAQQFEDVFGVGSEVGSEFIPRIWDAANQATDIKRAIEASRREMLAKVFKTKSTIKQVSAMAKLQQSKKSGVFILEGRKTESVTVPLEILQRLADGAISAKDAGLTVAESKAALEQWAESSARTRNATIERETFPGTLKEIEMSEMQALNYWLHWNQEAVRARMESHGWTEESIKQLRAFMSEETVEIGRWMSDTYATAGRALVDPVYRRLYHAPLPYVKNFAPTFYATGGNDSTLAIDQAQNSSGIMASFTKGRRPHNHNVRRVDAMTAFLSHFEHVSHWVSYVELLRDMKAVISSEDVQHAIIAQFGPSAASALTKRVKSIETQGNNQAWSLHEIDGMFARLNQARAFKGLSWRISPVVKQTSAVLNPLLADVPAHAYAIGLSKLFAGKLDVSGMWKSGSIQRRIEGGFSAEARIAMQATGGGPVGAVAIQVMSKGMLPMQWTDAGWNAVGAAIAYDYYRGLAIKAGENAEMAEHTAARAVDGMLATAAQPADLVNRSLIEGYPNPFVKAAWMFASESRKTLAIEYYAAKRLLTGKSKNKAMDVQRVVVAHVVMGAVTQLMSGLLASAFGGDDDEEREWSVGQWAAAILAGPINGLFVVGDGLNYLLRMALGVRAFRNLPGYVQLAADAGTAASHIDDLFDGDSEEMMKEINRLSGSIGFVASGFFGPAAQAADVILGNPLRDLAKALGD